LFACCTASCAFTVNLSQRMGMGNLDFVIVKFDN
jgi:hypothetical protein